MFEVIEQKKQEAVIKVIGVGGCGNNAVDFMIEKNVHGVDFISVNTDLQSLKKSQANNGIGGYLSGDIWVSITVSTDPVTK